MSNLAVIKESIKSLSKDDFIQLRHWFSDKDWQLWDEQIEMDVNTGKLDFLIKEALEEHRL